MLVDLHPKGTAGYFVEVIHPSLASKSKCVMPPSKSARRKITSDDSSSRVQGPSKRKRALPDDDDWNRHFFELMLYKARNGSIHVKPTDEEYTDLYKWVVQQRQEYKKFKRNEALSLLNKDRIQVLKAEQFSFGARNDETWLHRYDQLKQFKAKYGHTMVPRESAFPGLGCWVLAQRMQHNLKEKGEESEMNRQRKDLLDEIGFVWKLRNRTGWEARYNELVEFRSRHGHTIVPQNYPVNKALGKWVARQRMEYNYLRHGEKSLMTTERTDKLNEIGFVWYAKERSEDIELDFDRSDASSSS